MPLASFEHVFPEDLAPPTLRIDEWELSECSVPQDLEIPTREALFTVGNGFVGVRGFHENTETLSADSPLTGTQPSTLHPSPLLRGSAHLNTIEATYTNPLAGPGCSLRGTFLNGVYDEHLVSNLTPAFSAGSCKRECFLLSVPDAFDVGLYVGSERVSPLCQPLSTRQYRRYLDLRTAELKRRYVWTSSSGREIVVEECRFASAARKNVVATKFVVTMPNAYAPPVMSSSNGTTAKQNPLEIRVVSQTVLPSTGSKDLNCGSSVCSEQSPPTASQSSWEIDERHVTTRLEDVSSRLHVRTRRSRKDVVIATNERCFTTGPSSTMSFTPKQSEDDLWGNATSNAALKSAPPTFISPQCKEIEDGLETAFTTVVNANEVTTWTFVKYVAYVTSSDCDVEDIHQYATEVVESAVDAGYDGLLSEHKEQMEKFWSTSDVQIVCNDPRVQGTLRYNILVLFMSAGRWKGTSVGPRGLTGELFGGLQSWDAEVFVFPFFVHSHPSIARSLLQFRVDTLPQAMHRALDFELPRGALYPCRTINGGENAPSLSCTLHLHINSDIAYAIQMYFTATNDMDFMVSGGIAVLWQTALVLLQWGAWHKGVFHLRNVTGPDEYNVLVDNNYYTNLMAQHHLQFAVEMYDRLRQNLPSDLDRLIAQTGLELSDIKAMREAASHISLPYDPHNRIHLQDAGFLGKRSWDKVPSREGANLFPIRTPCTGSKVDLFSPETRQSTCDSSITSQGTTLPGDVSVENNRTDVPNIVLQEYHPIVVFRHRICKTADVILASILLPHKFTRDEKSANFAFYEPLTTHDSSLNATIFSIMSSELQLRDKAMAYFHYALCMDTCNLMKNTSGGLHVSCLAGSWCCVVNGFGGYRVVDGVIHISPWMPEGWDEYRFRVRHHGSLILVAVTRRAVTYTLTDGPKLLLVHAQSARVHLAKGRPVTVKLVKDVRSFDFDAVVFDLDAIIHNVEDDHFEAWRLTLDPLLRLKEGESFKPFNHEMYLAYLRHISVTHGKRHSGLQRFFVKRGIDIPVGDAADAASDATLYGLINLKLSHFRAIVKERGVKVRDGTLPLIHDLRENGVVVGCVSASKNGQWMLQQAPHIFGLIDCFIDANQGEDMHLRWRPELDYFDLCTKRMEATPKRTVVFVDGIDGFSKKSLQNYWLVVNTAADDVCPHEDFGEDATSQPLHVTDLSLLSTDVLHERGIFVPAANQNSESAGLVSPTMNPYRQLGALPSGSFALLPSAAAT